MFGRKIKSALLIDFDNIIGAVGREFGQAIPNWLMWLEDGQFDGKRRRRFLQKRVYWNAHNDLYRSAFEENGFEAVTCRSIVTNKSTADMIIALDALQSTYDDKSIQEYILLTTDTDFVPLVDKLGGRSKQTVNAGNKENLSFRVYLDHADIVISLDALKGAFKYERKKSILVALRKKWQGSATPNGAASTTGSTTGTPPRALPTAAGRAAASSPGSPAKGGEVARKTEARAAGTSPLEVAAEHIVEVAQGAPGTTISRKIIVRALKNRMPEFRTDGAAPFFGAGSYNNMLERITKLRDDLRLHKYGTGGRGISFRPKD